MRIVRFAVTVVVWFSLVQAAQADRVELRGGQNALDCKILVVNDEGIRISVGEEPMRVVAWDLVRSFEQETPMADADRFQKLAESLWRARSRVERGDTRLALSIFEELFPKYVGTTSETALVVMEGLLRCRLDRGSNDLAVIPALEVARLRLSGISTSSYSTLAPVVDSETLLCPVLPPVWAPSTTLVKVERQLGEYDAGKHPRVIAYQGFYRQAMRKQLAMSVESVAGAASQDAGVQLLGAILETFTSTPSDREGGRVRLLRQAQAMGNWAHAWARYFVGVSLLSESGEQQREEGIVNLLHVPARFSATQPYLAGLALAEATQALATLDNDEAATVLEEELRRAFPNHPVLTAGRNHSIARTVKESS